MGTQPNGSGSQGPPYHPRQEIDSTEEDYADSHYTEGEDESPEEDESVADSRYGVQSRYYPHQYAEQDEYPPTPQSNYAPIHYPTARYPPSSQSSLDRSEEAGHYGQYPTQGRNYRRTSLQYPPRTGSYGYVAAPQVPAGYGQPNPFHSGHGHGPSGRSYYPQDQMPMYGNDMMHYPNYYNRPPPNAAALPAYMQQFHISSPPGPMMDQQRSALVPTNEPPAPDPEKQRLQAEIDRMIAEREATKDAERRRELEAKMKQEANEEAQRRLDEHRKELELAKIEAERNARQIIENERKAEEQRAKQQAEALRQAEEKARLKFEAELKAAETKRKREEEDRKRAEEQAKIRLEAAIRAEAELRAAAEKKAKDDAERQKAFEDEAKRKAEAAAQAKVEAEKEAAKKKKEAEEEAKKEHEALTKRIQDETRAKLEEAARGGNNKATIKFKDAIGRKFSFPFHLCARWQGMEELIKQAFNHEPVLGRPVREGWYDLTGPDGEIILPVVWEKTIQPDWSITMTMWPQARMAGVGRGFPMPVPPGFVGKGGAMPGGIPPGIRVVNANKPSGSKGKDKGSSSKKSGFGSLFGPKPKKKKK